jgi:hypothetical protein
MDSVFNDDEHDTDVGNANAKNAQVLGLVLAESNKEPLTSANDPSGSR